MLIQLNDDDRRKLNDAKTILEKDLKSHITNQELALRVGTNEFKLKHGFKQLFNVTPFQFVTNIRVEKAKSLLEFTDYPIKKIAVDVGFRQSANFTKRFKKSIGCSPLKWRTNNKRKIV
jgi:transcriptional regulator GlxA family with amidase domain